MLTPREIIAEAWAITTKEKRLRRWGYASALFETLRNVSILLYQAYYFYFFIVVGERVGWISFEMALFNALSMWLFIALSTFLIILFIFELFFPTLATGAIIGLAAKSRTKGEVKGGLVLALYNFFPILELHGMFVFSSVTVIITVMSILYRFMEGGMRILVLAFAVFIAVISMLFRFFSSFAEEAVVINKLGIFQAIGRSFKLIISHLTHIFFLIILMTVIFVRVFINAIIILLIPIAIGGTFLLLTQFVSHTVSYGIASIVGMILLAVSSYFFAYLHVFSQTVWTITYMELNTQRDLDVIE